MKARSLTLLASLCMALSPVALGTGCGVASVEDDATEQRLGTQLSSERITSEAAFKAFSIEGGGFGQAGRLMKVMIDARDPEQKQPHFMNGNYRVGDTTPDEAKYHYNFAQRKLGISEDPYSFNEVTYFAEAKRYYAGTIQTYDLGDGKPVFALQFYPDDVIHEEGIVEAVRALKKGFDVPGARMAFVSAGQQQTFARVKGRLAELGFEAFTIEQMLGSVKYLPLNPGEAWGYLRVFPQDLGELRPTDLVLFDELPLDLSVVAGTITHVYQDVTSHVNLKSKERGTPNMVMRDAKTNADVARLKDKPVHLVVGKSGYKLEATTPELVEQKYKERTNRPWVQLPLEDEPNVLSFDDICKTLTPACTKQGNKLGGKAAMLGFLANKNVLGRRGQAGSESAKIGYDLVPHGFGIPVQFYRDFLNSPDNAALKSKIDDLIAHEKAGDLSPNDRRTRSKEVQELFYRARVPAAQLAAVVAQVERLKTLVPNLEKMKFRSSANAEDIPNFDGAGLHDSFSIKTTSTDNPDMSCRIEIEPDGVATKLEIKPKTPQCGIKGVYASLWNTRAIEERSFARLDHTTAGMGIAVVPAYDTESEVASNGVLITRAVNADYMAYTLSLQQGNNLVTNPEPGTISQMTFATFSDWERPPRFTTARNATPMANGPALKTGVLPDAEMMKLVSLARTVEIAYCRVKEGYYEGDCEGVWLDNDKPRSLDMEFKFLENGQFVLKQSREFHGR